MKKLLFFLCILLLSFSVVRSLNGVTPLTLGSFLSSLSEIDIDFERTLLQLIELKDTLKIPEISVDSNVFEKVGEFLKWLYNAFKGLFTVPVFAVRDFLDFLSSCFDFVQFLFG